MSRLLDHIKNAERKRREFQARAALAPSPEPGAGMPAAQIEGEDRRQSGLGRAAAIGEEATLVRARAEREALHTAQAALASMERERERAEARLAAERQIEARARARLEAEEQLAAAEKRKLLAEEALLQSAAEQDRLQRETASALRQRRADAAKRAAAAGRRRRIALARLGGSMRRVAAASALVAFASALGFGAVALWPQPGAHQAEGPSIGRAAPRAATPSEQPAAQGGLLLKMDSDAAGFAERAASRARGA
jgi:hypothetical protein